MTTANPLRDLPLGVLGKGRAVHMKYLVVERGTTDAQRAPRRGALTWREEASQLHTQSPDQAQAWRNHGLDVTAITDADEIADVITRDGVVWVTP